MARRDDLASLKEGDWVMVAIGEKTRKPKKVHKVTAKRLYLDNDDYISLETGFMSRGAMARGVELPKPGEVEAYQEAAKALSEKMAAERRSENEKRSRPEWMLADRVQFLLEHKLTTDQLAAMPMERLQQIEVWLNELIEQKK